MADYMQFDESDTVPDLVYDSKGNIDFVKEFATSFAAKLKNQVLPIANVKTSNFIADTLTIRKNASPAFSYLWRIELPDNAGGTNIDMNIRVTSVDAPTRQFETKRSTINSTFFHTAVHSEVGSLQVRIDEFEDGATLKYFDDWMARIRQADGLYFPPSMYKKDIKLIKLSNTNLDLHYSMFSGCFPTSISPVNYDYENTGIVSYNVTFSVSDVEHMFVPKKDVIAMTSAMQGAFRGDKVTGFGQFSVGGIASEIYDTVGNFIKDASSYIPEFGKSIAGSTDYSSFGAGDVITGLKY